jgi:hypothetical protein
MALFLPRIEEASTPAEMMIGDRMIGKILTQPPAMTVG